LLGVAFSVGPHLPEPLVRAVAAMAADLTWLRHGAGVRRLEANLARVVPDLDQHGLRRLSRAGMRSYLRYFGEVLTMDGLTGEQIDARVLMGNHDWIRERVAHGRSVVVALGHLGNWDLAGAGIARRVEPVTTVAERLEPESVFQDFLALRERLGLRIIPLAKGDGGPVFRQLVQVVRSEPGLVPLLADRDLTSHGIEVDLFGERARVAAGPAALAAAGQVDLAVAIVSYERLHGQRRRAAGSPWGIRLDFSGPIDVDPSLTGRARVTAHTQAWVDLLAAGIAAHPTDWHMLQRLFVADLDPARRRASTDGPR
jgi:KDO2-lipid IV(A) lauroyltransferase